MSEEEPAWKAALKWDLAMTGHKWQMSQKPGEAVDAVFEATLPHIRAAEQRGRERGLRAMATELRRTPKDSRDYPAALTGARLIEDALDSQ